MIVVFVVDTSPSMRRPVVSGGSGSTTSSGGGMSRLDLAKMIVEDLSRRLRKGCMEHNGHVVASPSHQRSLSNIGQGPSRMDSLLLLSTSRQHPDTAACAVGGRLLVGFGIDTSSVEGRDVMDPLAPQQHLESFQHELKSLTAAKWDAASGVPFPDDAGGATGLNMALSAGLQLLSRYRLQNSQTENFGMGRFPSSAIQTVAGPATAALQPAVLILVTDGACLRHPPSAGGGSLQLQYGSQPLREFYKEPFRWDQRVYCLAVGDYVNEKGQYLHPQLRALCEVTGGSHWLVRKPSSLPTESLLQHLHPPMPRVLPLPDPLYLPLANNPIQQAPTITTPMGMSFINGGPICCFQSMEGDDGRPPVQRRAMLLYTGSAATCANATGADSGTALSQPLWCIPEEFFPSKKLDTLPPRSAQPLFLFSKRAAALGSKTFEAMKVIKLLHRLDQAILANRQTAGQSSARLLHRDVYVCEWLSPDGSKPIQVSISSQQEYFPVLVRGAGRVSLAEDGESFLNIGILHAPLNCSTLGNLAPSSRLATLTLLPPEPHILLPLLLRAADAEHRVLKKSLESNKPQQRTVIPLDEQWRTEFQAYMFRLPPYYHHSFKRCLRLILPASVHPQLLTDTWDSLPLQCFSKVCFQKIRNAEQIARDTNERLERQEASLRQQSMGQPHSDLSAEKQPALRYGQFDPRSSVESYLAALRSMPPPWHVAGGSGKVDEGKHDTKSDTASNIGGGYLETPKSAVEVLGDLPAKCLMAYYESRRRWIFGGPSLTTRGLHVEGVSNDGSNSHRCGKTWNDRDECPLSLAGVGVSMMNESSTTKMGDYRERLLFSRSPVVGYGSNDAAGVAATTAADGSPVWSVDDDAMPLTFFDPRSGEFVDSAQARVRSRLMVNFGNPYKEKRANSLIPEKFYSQAPSMQQGGFGSIIGSPRTPPGSPPHDSFESVEEGEAIFVRTSPSRSSPKRDDPEDSVPLPVTKRQRSGSIDESDFVPAFDSTDASQKPKPPLFPTPPPPTSKPQSSDAPLTPARLPNSASEQGQAVAPPSKPVSQKKAPVPPPKAPPRPPPPPPTKEGVVLPQAIAPPPPPRPPPKGEAPHSRPSASVAAAPVGPVSAPIAGKSQTKPPHRGSLSGSVGGGSIPPPQLDAPQSPDQKPTVELPPGWMCVWSKSQKRWYYFDTKTNQSVWKWPP